MRKKVLIFGRGGQLGTELTNLLAQHPWEVTAYDRRQGDLRDTDAIARTIETIKPDVIVNCAAYTAVDRAEGESELAFRVNRDAPTAMAIAAQKINSYLIHISTDYVFDGKHYLPYTENDPTNPISVYGKSKLAGEQAIATATDKYLVIRTAWVYGTHGTGNFVKTMLRLGQEREKLTIVSDQIGSPTWTKDLSIAISQIIQQLSPDLTGIYHYTNSGVCSWYDLAVASLQKARILGFPLQVKNIIPIPTKDYPTPAPRPHYSVLCPHKITNILGHHPPHWQESLEKMLQEYSAQPR